MVSVAMYTNMSLMEGKRLTILFPPMLLIIGLLFQGCFSKVNHSTITTRKLVSFQSIAASDLMGTSSLVFPLTGNIYPSWSYYLPINIGTRTKPFQLLVDSGSDLTWVKCDGPCENCTKGKKILYKPPKDSIVPCEDPLCVAVQGKERNCTNPTDRCEYVIEYGDESSTHGYLVRDNFHLRLINGSIISSTLVFGCGYKQIGHFSKAGIIGLSMNPSNILSQIHEQSLIQKRVGHCFSSKGGGFLFFGDDLVPDLGISWTSIIDNPHKTYTLEPANLFFDGSPTQVKGLRVDFDSGASITSLNKQSYRTIRDRLILTLEGKQFKISEPESILPICWREDNGEPIRFFNNINHYFKNLSLHFTKELNVKFDLPLHAYLLLIKGKVCLGIVDGDGLDLENVNIIGAIAMQDKLMIYDNVNLRVGWTSHDCNMPSMP